MDPLKSQVDFYVDLCSNLIAADPLGITSSKSISRDIATLQLRVSCEGLSFLTKTLPKLGKALDLGLIEGRFIIPDEFGRAHCNESIPAFMQAYFNLLFDECGAIRGEATIYQDAVKHLRQVAFLCYKLELPYDQEVLDRVIETFIDVDDSLELSQDEETTRITNVATFITRDIFQDFDPKDILPRHGPGSVATGEVREDKWTFARLFNRIHQMYPYYDYFVVGRGREIGDRLAWYKSLIRLEEGCTKVVLVPKDSRGPRLISEEPLEFQWVQQGLGRKIMMHLESCYRTRGQINFTNQEINQKLAFQSSQSGEFATLDLKDASDRVSLDLVRKVFSRVPYLLKHLEACRSSYTVLPDGSTLLLKKFAPMGSALCFPVEAFIFWVICVATVSRALGLRQSQVGKRIFVYGDDIIVPTDWAALCIQGLERCSLVVNRSKSCITGKFRESCGVDAFNGVNVTPVRLRTLWSGRKTDGSAYASYVETLNHLSRIRNDKFVSVYHAAVDYVRGRLERTYGRLPWGTSFSAYPCIDVDEPEMAEMYNLQHFRSRYSRRYQKIEFCLTVLTTRKTRSKLDDWLRLIRDMTLGPGEEPSVVIIPRSMKIGRGWRAVV